ncbi:transcription elongation factor spt6, partial [Hortaea werneckii]
EDLDLIGIGGGEDREQGQSKFKRLKRGHREERKGSEARGVEDIFSDEEEGEGVAPAARGRGFGGFGQDEMDDFIEQDEFPDEEGGGLDEDLGIRAPTGRANFADIQKLQESGMDEATMEDFRGAFGDGDEFAWALEAEAEHNEENADPDKPLELKDVFEPSQLQEKMLTDEDNEIRMTDVPERLQLARRSHKPLNDLSPEELDERHSEEAAWISSTMFPRTRMEGKFREPFEAAVKSVLDMMNRENFEPPFIFQNRKDFLIHSEQVPASPDPEHPNAPPYKVNAEKLLGQDDLWNILEQDLKFRAFCERREAIRTSLGSLKELMGEEFNDPIFEELLSNAVQIEDLQDIQDYLNFQYSAQLRDIAIAQAEEGGQQKRARGAKGLWDKIRAGSAYHLVRAFGITADALAVNIENGPKTYTEDPDKRPDDLADTLIQEPEFRTSEDVLKAAKSMFIEELCNSPRFRRFMRKTYFERLVFDVKRTEKGVKVIDEEHPYYEFKYLRNWEARNFLLDRPELFLKMLRAESEGLVEVIVRIQGEKQFRADLHKAILSDNFSEVADAWN